jgi:riboflavin kinase/FMN adenylyltransferase
MIVTRNLQDVKQDKNSIITIGTFDGVHLGHQSIFKRLLSCAKVTNNRSVVVTFEPHPREVVGKGPVMLLNTLNERIELIRSIGIDLVHVIDFSYEFSRLSSLEFYQQFILKGIGVKTLIVGHDHMFARDRKSNIDELKRIGREMRFDVEVIKPVSVDGEVISSTKIRNILLQGDVDRAAKYLDRPYSLEGNVIEGDKRGETLGFPTANIQPKENNKLIPCDGVYFVAVKFNNNQFYGMLNIGTNPTFKTDHSRIIEVNIFGVNESLYGKELILYFLKRIRTEIKFSSKEELIIQLQQDRVVCEKYISEVQQLQISLKKEK